MVRGGSWAELTEATAYLRAVEKDAGLKLGVPTDSLGLFQGKVTNAQADWTHAVTDRQRLELVTKLKNSGGLLRLHSLSGEHAGGLLKTLPLDSNLTCDAYDFQAARFLGKPNKALGDVQSLCLCGEPATERHLQSCKRRRT
eukprot:m.271782 g.271782  ORF g.271782 m.271782 type:complete len:142 (+) comp22839_c1_seq7:1686-2111(+)